MRSGADRSRYGVLETLRAYGRDRLRENGIADEYASRHAQYYTELAERAAIGMHGPDEGAWVERMLPDYDNLRAAFEHAIADRDVDTALRLVTSLSEFVHLRIGYESSGWAERAVELADPDHPLLRRRRRVRRAGSVEQGRVRPGAVAGEPGAAGACPAAATAASPIRATCWPTWRCTRVTRTPRWRTTTAEMARARGDDDPIRLVWTLFYVAICHAALRAPEDGLAAAEEAVAVSDETANPTARSMARYALGLVLKKSEPDRALALVRRGGRAGRVGAELLVAWHRVDGGRGHPRRARRNRNGGARLSSMSSTIGTGSGTGASSGSTSAT